MKKTTKIILMAVIALVIVLIFFYPRMELYFSANDGEDIGVGTPQAQQASALPVNVVEVQPETLDNNLSVTGTLIPNEMVNLRPEVAGLVLEIPFKEGEFVKKGTPLLYLNDDELKAQYQRLEYTKKLYESQENRQKELLAREAISQEEYDIVLNQFNTNLADLSLVEAQLNKMVVRAPFDGVLGLRQVSQGSVIGNTDVIASIVNVDPIKIEFSIPERYANEIKPGARVYFSTNVSIEEGVGKVYAIEPNIDASTRTLRIRAESPNKDRKFLPGMFVRVRIVLSTQEDALLVPAESLVPELEGYKVFVVNDGKVESRRVAIGQRTDRRVQIIDGLRPGEQVLTTGILQARDGMPLAINQVN
ncbi:efflux RND transporter periplasmic adaptor subunit [Pleomorphovibrio marinus]|uniref:efflux RND transporter periplasmic adaptor subunit n=1 Tax=Pleomorphovibrio marinus TaxID=2164132 RepID=UPI000E0A7BEC|nr:efflux RND transporter periplasmic adaptor subunit [Pleomorphovibrio marinus]